MARAGQSFADAPALGARQAGNHLDPVRSAVRAGNEVPPSHAGPVSTVGERPDQHRDWPAYNATNPFAVLLQGGDGTTGYIITNQPKSFDWRAREAKPHPWERAPEDVFESVCDKLDRIIQISSHQ